LLRRYWNEDLLSASQIAGLLGVTRNAVIGRARRMELDWRTTANRKPVRDLRSKPRAKPRVIIKPQPVRAAAPTILPTATPARPVHLLKLKGNGCRWLMGEPASLMFCGQPQQADSSWCAAHHQDAHVVLRQELRMRARR
jgi:hypothetical protein